MYRTIAIGLWVLLALLFTLLWYLFYCFVLTYFSLALGYNLVVKLNHVFGPKILLLFLAKFACFVSVVFR